MATSTEYHICEICGSGAAEHGFFARDTNRRVDDREFAIYQCGGCGSGFTIPKLDVKGLSRYYTQEYYSIDSNIRLEEATRKHNRKRIDRIRRFIPTGKLLDVGAGTGMFLKTAVEAGYDAEGLEISTDAASLGSYTWGLNIRTGNILEASFEPACYDVVTLWHVYEHLHQPRQVAKQLHGLLRPGGLLVIAVPNFDSVQARLFRASWFHLDVPRHLFHYTPASMTSLLASEGFSAADVNYFSAEHNWAGILGSVMQLSRPGESLPHKLLRKALGVPLARTLAALEAAAGKGGTFELYVTKQ